ncbi:TlpA family protein disulfide reductase [Homoserinibacter sp. GY 40078]|nr:TlpA family protein disulfide reductase [Homoserinibacter sp. GY 40078]
MRFVAPLALAGLLLAGCTAESGHLAEQYEQGTGGGYISGDGRLVTIAPADREPAVVFGGTLDSGEPISSDELVGRVVVVNFWYASCPPCREEAPDLEKLHQQFSDDDVTLLGVNVSDDAGTALAFAEEHGVTYPSIIDVADNGVQLAFAGGAYAPNSVPTTLILDREGRVAARYSGLIDSPSVVADIIDDLLAETD